MKLLEKMASQEFPDDYNSNEEFIDKEDLRDAYIAGFKAAREMAAQVIEGPIPNRRGGAKMKIIDLSFKDLKIGDVVKTKEGFTWVVYKKIRKKVYWLDKISGLVWHPVENEKYNHCDAIKKFADKLPTKEEWEEAEKHGIREVSCMKNMFLWSGSVHPNYSDIAYDFSGYSGCIGYDSRYHSSISVRCVGR